jgi:hypothetical protein
LFTIVKRFFRKVSDRKEQQVCDSSELDELISKAINSKFNSITDKVIEDVSDLKADYLKRYLEVRMNANDAFLSHLSSKVDVLQLKFVEMQNNLLNDES